MIDRLGFTLWPVHRQFAQWWTSLTGYLEKNKNVGGNPWNQTQVFAQLAIRSLNEILQVFMSVSDEEVANWLKNSRKFVLNEWNEEIRWIENHYLKNFRDLAIRYKLG